MMCSNTPITFLVGVLMPDWSEIQWWYSIAGRVSEGGTDEPPFCTAVPPALIVVVGAILDDMIGVAGGVECCDIPVGSKTSNTIFPKKVMINQT